MSQKCQKLIAGLILLSLVSYLDVSAQEEEDKGSCETLPSSIHVTKEEHDEAGNVVRNCEGDVVVNKCEGTCSSQMQPSVVTPTGFLKECVCCRENWMKQREVQLTDCFDPDGKRILTRMGTMTILIQEPEGCGCHKCGL